MSVISIPLPSRGLVYPPDHPFFNRHKLYIKSMTAIEEDILLNQTYRKDGSVYERMISSLLIEPKISMADAKELVVGDKQVIILSARISAYGSRMEVKVPCPVCQAEVDLCTELNKASIQEFSADNIDIIGPNKFEFTVGGNNQIVIQFKFPTKIEFIKDNPVKPILDFLREHIISINGNADKKFVYTTCEKFPIKQSNKIRTVIETSRPWMTIETEFSCHNCQHYEPVAMSCDHDLFPLNPENREQVWLEPFFVLMYYAGWSWESFLNFPIEYRRWLISRINKEISRATEEKHDIGDKSPPHNTPEIRQMAGMAKQFTPNAKMQRFS